MSSLQSALLKADISGRVAVSHCWDQEEPRYCAVLYFTVLYFTVLYYTSLYCTVLYCTVRQGDVFGFMVEHHAKQGQYRPALALLQVTLSPVA